MKTKVTDLRRALGRVKSGDTVMIGGFLRCGHPDLLVRGLCDCPVDGLTVVSNDTGTADNPGHDLIKSGRVSCVVASYIGANPETGRLMTSGEMQVELVPQGTLAERIRAGGAGLGGVLTEVGLGTVVEQGKQKITLDGREWLLELPLRGDVALIKAETADEAGNLYIPGTARNFNTVMATAAAYVVAQVDRIVDAGKIDPDAVTVPGIFVDAIVLTSDHGKDG